MLSKNKCAYTVLGVDMDGQKDILGVWISENESAGFWAGGCSDLKKRGVTDIFVACHDNLKGLSDAISATFPKTKSQLCIVYQIRNSVKVRTPQRPQSHMRGFKENLWCSQS